MWGKEKCRKACGRKSLREETLGIARGNWEDNIKMTSGERKGKAASGFFC